MNGKGLKLTGKGVGEALIKASSVPSRDPFTPGDIPSAIALAEQLSQANLVPKDLRGDTGSIVIIMAQSHALGIPWTTGMQEIHTIHGRISYSAQLLKALAERDPAFEYIYVTESDDQSATVKVKRKEWEEAKEYMVTIEEAHKAGYLDGRHSGVWKTRPRIMLAWMALRESARLWGSGSLLGMYADEEVRAIEVEVEDVTEKKTKTKTLADAVKKDLDATPVKTAKVKAKKVKPAKKKVAREKPPTEEVEPEMEQAEMPEPEGEVELISDEDFKKIQDYVHALDGGLPRQKSVWTLVKLFMENHTSMAPGYTSLKEVPADKVKLVWAQLVKAEEGVPVEEEVI